VSLIGRRFRQTIVELEKKNHRPENREHKEHGQLRNRYDRSADIVETGRYVGEEIPVHSIVVVERLRRRK